MRALAVPFSLALLLLAEAGLADTDSINLGPSALPAASDGLSRALSPEALPPGSFRANVWLGYERSPLVLEDARALRSYALIQDRVLTDYALALGVVDRLELSIAIPLVSYQSGDNVSELIDRPPLPATAFRNLELGFKTTWLALGDVGGLTLGSRGAVALPTGSRSALVSSGSPEGELALLSGLHLLVLELRASAGVRLLGAEPSFLRVRYGNEFKWNLGVQFRPIALGWDMSGATRLGLEFSGASGLGGLAVSGADARAVRLGVSRGLGSISINGGAQLPLDSLAGNPKVGLFLGIGWSGDD